MLTSLKVTGFRNLSSLSMEGLTRVNLLVGENNAGKTSVLEAIEILLLARSEPWVLANGPLRRGESVPLQLGEDQIPGRLDLENLFHGSDTSPESRFEILGESSDGPRVVSCSIKPAELDRGQREPHRIRLGQPLGWSVTSPSIEGEIDRGLQTFRLPLNLSVDKLGRAPTQLVEASPRSGAEGSSEPPALFVGTGAPAAASIGAMWDGVVLTPEEMKVVEALRLIQPDIERLAWVHTPLGRGTSGMLVKLHDSDRRFPLGSMGEGIKRLLVLAMNLVKSAGGYLLVDEIDTGLHYSVMVKMWKLVVETARRLDIQIFATSHSLDCIQALAGLYENEPDVRDEISLHRIEKGAEASIRYSADEILAAARRQVEVR
ncbi:AAA family ATPase [Archangium gephyra]|uniref:AAA family ATPase n=1 Tax=Archangium gephyra TaxID=48 RepID=UPI003B7D9CFB